jgi:AraC family transcriptional regulator of adaptative response / DNA-3-methyladenine glycosylase II
MRLIADGAVDRAGVPGLATRLGYTERHLHRVLAAEVGAGPLALARAQRAQTARVLIETTDLGLAEIAFAAGFGSVRQFNDTIREIYDRAPSELRAARRPVDAAASPGTITLRLPYRAPLHVEALLEFLRHRAIEGVEEVTATSYQRSLLLPHGPAEVTLTPRTGYVSARLRLSEVSDLAPAVARCRRLFDLDADPVAVDSVLASDPALAAAVAREPGVRAPRAIDGFEMAVRAIVGQQVSVASARRVLALLVSATAQTRFPTADELLTLPDDSFPMPAARRRTLRALAEAVAAGTLDLDGGADREATAESLLALPGVGPWTQQYIALRALGDPDAFLPSDVVVRRAAAALGFPDDPTALAAYAERWRPWRAYAVIRLWRHQ